MRTAHLKPEIINAVNKKVSESKDIVRKIDSINESLEQYERVKAKMNQIQNSHQLESFERYLNCTHTIFKATFDAGIEQRIDDLEGKRDGLYSQLYHLYNHIKEEGNQTV